MSVITNVSSSLLQSALGTALQGTGPTNKTPQNSVNGISGPSDSGQLSPFAQLMSTLQQLQQSDPAKYKQVTHQIATNLQAAAQSDLANGNSGAANQLNQLATDFTNASTNGQLPNVQDLAQAIGGHHHHHHHAASVDPNNSSARSGSSDSAANQSLSQFLSAFQINGPQGDSLNPMSIIMNTLSDAGISGASL